MASPQPYPNIIKPIINTHGVTVNQDIIVQRLKDLGNGPHTPEQQKQKETLMNMLSQLKKENLMTSQTQANNPTISNVNNVNLTDTSNVNTNQNQQILDKKSLQELVKEVDPTEQLDEDVEDMLLQVADDFIENIINSSCQLAKHRKSNILEAKDVQFHLERNFNIWIAGFSTEELKTFKKSYGTEAHKQRLQLIKKSSQTTAKPSNEAKDKNKE